MRNLAKYKNNHIKYPDMYANNVDTNSFVLTRTHIRESIAALSYEPGSVSMYLTSHNFIFGCVVHGFRGRFQRNLHCVLKFRRFHKDIQCIERVQRFFTRAIIKRAGIPYMDYDDRLANLGLQSLEYRRVFYDLVMCYKIYNNLVDLPFESFFAKPARPYSIRGHPCILRSNIYPIMHSERIFSLNV